MHAVLFDWDGTLVDTLPFMFAATELVMAEYGAPITWADYRRHFSPDWRLLYRRFGLPERDIESVGVRWWSLYRGRDEAMLLPGAAEALRRLAAAGFALGVVLAGQPGEIAYVGDALDDMRMALAARARGVGIRSDLATDGELRAAGASEVADSVAAWVDVLLG